MNYHQTPEEIIKNATAEQRILWNYIFLRFGERVGISQFAYFGSIAGSGELIVYDARKMYLALVFAGSSGSITNAPCSINIFDEGNVLIDQPASNFSYWDTAAAGQRIGGSSFELRTLLFSRIAANAYAYTRFIGYKLTI